MMNNSSAGPTNKKLPESTSTPKNGSLIVPPAVIPVWSSRKRANKQITANETETMDSWFIFLGHSQDAHPGSWGHLHPVRPKTGVRMAAGLGFPGAPLVRRGSLDRMGMPAKGPSAPRRFSGEECLSPHGRKTRRSGEEIRTRFRAGGVGE